MPFGIDPCQVGGTDIAPTNRALPKSAAAPKPAPPPKPFIAGATSPANFGISAAARPADANPAELAFADCAAFISGPINMLAGYMPAWATESNDCTGRPAAADCTAVTAPGTPATAPSNTGDTAADAAVAAPATCAPTCDAKPVTCDDSPAKLAGGKLNGVNVEATDVAPHKRRPNPLREATRHHGYQAERPGLIFIPHAGVQPPWQLLAVARRAPA